MAQRNHRYFSVIVEPEDEPGDDGPQVPGYGASVGDVLRHARQQTGYALSDVADVLRIRLRYLEAIEDGRFDDLPGSVYAVGFIRAYAEFLGLDTDEMVRRFKDEVAGIDRQTELHFPEPVAEGRVPGGAILLIAVVLAAVAYGGWFYLSSENRSFDDMVPQLPDRFVALLSGEPAVEPPIGQQAGPAAGNAPRSGAALPQDAGNATAASDDAPAATGPAGDPGVDRAGPSASTDLAGLEEVDIPAPAVMPPAATPAEAPAPRTGAPAATARITPSDTASGDTASGDTAPEDTAPDAAAPGSVAPDAAVSAPGADATAPAGAVASVDGTEPAASTPAEGESLPAGSQGPAPTASAPTESAPAESAPAANTPAANTPAVPADDTADTGTPTETAAAEAPRPSASAAQASADPAGRVVLQATADSWVQVRDGAGNLVMTRVLRPGDVYEVPDLPGLTMVTGNAGGLDILVDGRSVPTLGDQGEVLRDVSLDARALTDGTAR